MLYEQMFNFKKFSEKLYTAGMPTKEQLEDIKKYVQLVINLAPHDSHDALLDEEHIVKSLGMDYVNIPVDWNSPTRDNLTKFMDLMDNIDDKKILVHCQANFRASSFVTMYRILRKGWDETEALNLMREIWDEQTYPIWDEFISETIEEFKKEEKNSK